MTVPGEFIRNTLTALLMIAIVSSLMPTAPAAKLLFFKLRNTPEFLEPWSFADAVLFCFTIITTIGYGNVAPKSFEGRMFCICYGLIGVPFALLAIADLGKFLSEIIDGWKKTHRQFFKGLRKRWLHYKRSGKWSLKLPSDLRSVDAVSCNDVGRLIPVDITGSLHTADGDHRDDRSKNINKNSPNMDEIDAEAQRKILAKSLSHRSVSGESVSAEDEEDEEEDITSNQTYSLLVMFLLYIITGSFMLSSYEPDMTFFKAFYFNFVSLTSIGLGDVVPQSETYLVFTLLYIAIGLALTTIAIEIAADTLKKLHYFGRKIENVGNVVIWFGGKKLTMKSLVKNLGDQLNLPTTTIKSLNLDEFVDNAIKVEEGELETLRPPPIEPTDLDLEIVNFADDEEEEWIYEPTPEPDLDPPTPLTAHYPTPSPKTARRATPEPQIARVPTPTLETARAVTPELETARNPTPCLSPKTARDPSPEAVSARLPTPTPYTAREPSPEMEEWRLRGAYSEEAYRRYLEYQKQWQRFRQTSHTDAAAEAAANAGPFTSGGSSSRRTSQARRTSQSRRLSEKEIKAEKKMAKKAKKK